MNSSRTTPLVNLLALLAALFTATATASAQDKPRGWSSGLKDLWTSARTGLATFNPNAGPGKGKSLVFGAVVDPDGKGIEGVGVVLGSLEGLEASVALREPLARTDAKGEFVFELRAPTAEQVEHRKYLLAVGADRVAARVTMPTISYLPPVDWRAPKDATEGVGRAGLDILARVWGRAAKPKPVGAELPKLVLRHGRRLRGCVVDGSGKPVSGARVIATDLLVQSRFSGMAKGDSKYVYTSYATTGADGMFDLPGVFATGSLLRIEKKGYFDTSRPVVASEAPVTLAIQRGGIVRGRVIGRDGKAAQASIQVSYEVSPTAQTEKVDKDGAFEFELKYPHRYRLRLNPSGTSAKEHGTTYSAILAGPRQDLVVTLDPKTEATAKPKATGKPKPIEGGKYGLAVSVVDRYSAAPLVDFKAAGVWVSAYYADNEPYLRTHAASRAKNSTQPGYIRVPGPTSESARDGGVVVLAKGYATQVLKIDWSAAQQGRLVAAMVPESIIAGVVRDETTGEPIKGASVRLYAYSDDRRRSQSTNKSTGLDGRFEFDALAAGYYRVQLSYKNRKANVHEIELRAEAKRADVDFLVARGAAVRGRITGMQIGEGWQAELLTEGHIQSMRYNPGYRVSGTKVKVGVDGRFEFAEVAPGYYELCVLIPRDQRRGGAMQIPLEPIRVRQRDIELDLDASADRPGRIRGKVVLRGEAIDPARLLVVAGPASSRSPWSYYYRNNIDISGARSQVRADGTYDLEVEQGSHELSVIDVVTGVTLCETLVPVEIEGADSVERDLEVALTRVRVKVLPKKKGGSVAASWLDIDVELPQPEAFQMMMFFSDSQNRKPSGWSLQGYTGDVIDLILPLYKTRLRVQTDVGRLARTKIKPNSVIGEHEFTPEAGKVAEIEIEVEVPDQGLDPDPEEEEKKKKAEAGEVDAKGIGKWLKDRRGVAPEGEAKPSAAKPSAAKPSAAKPSAAKPSAAKPSAAKPSAAKPSAAKPPAAKAPAAKPPTVHPPDATPPNGSAPDAAVESKPTGGAPARRGADR